MAPINKLPIELLQMTLLYFRPQSHNQKELRRVVELSGVCKLWRETIVNTSHFWIFVNLDFPSKSIPEDFDNEPQRLEMLLGRTGTSHIHVKWDIRSLDRLTCPQLLAFIAKNAPFNRWRSLDIISGPDIEYPLFTIEELDKCGGFTTLDEITLDGLAPVELVQFVGSSINTVTNFSVKTNGSWNKDNSAAAYRLLVRADQLSTRCTVLSAWESFGYTLPSGITHIRLLVSGYISKPSLYITHLTVNYLLLESFQPHYFPELTYLCGHFYSLPEGRHVILPKLRHIAVELKVNPFGCISNGIVSFSSQELDTIQIFGNRDPVESEEALTQLNDAVCSPHYHLSPTTLIFEANISPQVISNFLKVSKRLQHLTIHVQSPGAMYGHEWDLVFNALSAQADGAEYRWQFCPELIGLEIFLNWARPEQEIWDEYATKVTHARTGGPMKSIMMYWKCGTKYNIYR